MDIYFVGNALLMLGAFAMQFGLIGDEISDAGTSGTGSADPDVPSYDPALFGSEEVGAPNNNNMDYSGSPLGVAVLLGEGYDALEGSIPNDIGEGGAGHDVMGMRPSDVIASGGTDDDLIESGLGNETVVGGVGSYQITGNADNDTLTGSEGGDTFEGGESGDALYGNTEAIPALTEDGSDVRLGGEGGDVLYLTGGDQGLDDAGTDSFVQHDPTDSGATTELIEYDASNDVIGVIYTPSTDPNTGDPVVPVVSVETSAGDSQTIVSLDGVEIARVIGGQNLTAADIALILE